MSDKPKGTLIIIGGAEEKEPEEKRNILRRVVEHAQGGKLVLMPIATTYPEETVGRYTEVFSDLGLEELTVVDIRTRGEALGDKVELLKGATVIFFSGGDQLRLTSQLCDTPIFSEVRRLYESGGVIVGTSAGAAAMPETMLIGGVNKASIGVSAISMAPGMGLINGLIIDSHFAERGRFSRLLAAVAQNAHNLGLGIDENTAIVVEREESFEVVGSGAVYVIDGAPISYSSLSEERNDDVLTIFDVRMHVLGENDRFDLRARRPVMSPEQQRAVGEAKFDGDRLPKRRSAEASKHHAELKGQDVRELIRKSPAHNGAGPAGNESEKDA